MSVLRGDCVEVMAGMEPDSVDAIVCDPPYGLEFMGKEWDRLGPNVSRWEGRRTLTDGAPPTRKPDTPGGRHAAKVASPASNLRCSLCGHYKFSGTPCKCPEPRWEARPNEQSWRMERWHAQWAQAAIRVAKPGAYLLAFGGTRTVHRMTCALEDAGWVIRDMLVWAYAQGFPKSRASLKPAWEPIVLCRKPGASRDLNIDAARIPGVKPVVSAIDSDKRNKSILHTRSATGTGEMSTEGRWPANVILTDPILDGGWDGVVGGGVVTTAGAAGRKGSSGFAEGYDGDYTVPYGDTGTPSRYFYIPKAPTRERVLSDGRRSPHPTQKPEALIRHLVTLVTPPGGLVLDPFLGSGTLGVVCDGLGMRWQGIEREPEYADWAEARIADKAPAWEVA